MLKLNMIMMSTLLLPLMWNNSAWLISAMLIMSSIMSMLILMSSHSYMILTNNTAIDQMSFALIILTIWVTAMMIMASTKIIMLKNNSKLFIMTCVILLMILINCFSASSMISFYIWFEASLIPTMVLIMAWGYQPERSQASMYLMMYTITASLPMLASIMKVIIYSKTSIMPMFMVLLFPSDYPFMFMAWMLMIGGFLVKLPLFTVHLWLPKAHVEAPIAGSMILAAILLKLGGYGLLRLSYIFQEMSKNTSALLSSVALVGGVVTSLICLRQSDLKSLIAYSSVGHMGLMIAGALTSCTWGFQAALAMMIAHGLSSSALFVMANINYEMTKTRSLFMTKGLMVVIPTMTMWWFLFTASNMAAPPSINLLSEIMLISSIMSLSSTYLILLGMISFFTAAYSLYMYTSMHHGAMSTISNPMPATKQKEFSLMLMHLSPIILIITKPELITSWN